MTPSKTTQYGLTIAQQDAAKRAEKHQHIARLRKALRIRAAIERASDLREQYGPARILAAVQQWGDPQWDLVCRWAKTHPASADTRKEVISLLRERVAVTNCASRGGHYRDNQDICHACGVSL